MYSFESRIRYSECDETGSLSIRGMIDYLQDCSTFHAIELGLGPEHMRRNHYSWLVAAWQIEIEGLPALGETITTGTWCPGLRRSQAVRCFTITSSSSTVLVRADSLWFVFDTQKGMPIRVPPSQLAYVSGEPRIDLPPTRRRAQVEGPFVELAPIVVSERLLDTNRHVNNANYIQMALDGAAHADGYHIPHRIYAQYRSMALLGDTIHPRLYGTAGDRTVGLMDKRGNPYAIVNLERWHDTVHKR